MARDKGIKQKAFVQELLAKGKTRMEAAAAMAKKFGLKPDSARAIIYRDFKGRGDKVKLVKATKTASKNGKTETSGSGHSKKTKKVEKKKPATKKVAPAKKAMVKASAPAEKPVAAKKSTKSASDDFEF